MMRAKSLLQIGVCFVCDNKDLGYTFAASSPRFFLFSIILIPIGFDACYSQLVQRSSKISEEPDHGMDDPAARRN